MILMTKTFTLKNNKYNYKKYNNKYIKIGDEKL
jgi:hypothetical protein